MGLARPIYEHALILTRFILNGLHHANDVLGEAVFRPGAWRVIGEYVYDGEGGRHQTYYAPRRTTAVMGDLIRPHDRILIEISMKYSREEAERLWNLSGLVEVDRWSRNEEYGELHTRRLVRPCLSGTA